MSNYVGFLLFIIKFFCFLGTLKVIVKDFREKSNPKKSFGATGIVFEEYVKIFIFELPNRL